MGLNLVEKGVELSAVEEFHHERSSRSQHPLPEREREDERERERMRERESEREDERESE